MPSPSEKRFRHACWHICQCTTVQLFRSLKSGRLDKNPQPYCCVQITVIRGASYTNSCSKHYYIKANPLAFCSDGLLQNYVKLSMQNDSLDSTESKSYSQMVLNQWKILTCATVLLSSKRSPPSWTCMPFVCLSCSNTPLFVAMRSTHGISHLWVQPTNNAAP